VDESSAIGGARCLLLCRIPTINGLRCSGPNDARCFNWALCRPWGKSGKSNTGCSNDKSQQWQHEAAVEGLGIGNGSFGIAILFLCNAKAPSDASDHESGKMYPDNHRLYAIL
jgi:hypothetical protein